MRDQTSRGEKRPRAADATVRGGKRRRAADAIVRGDDRGATAVEYSIVASAIAAVVVTIAISVGDEVKGLFQTLADLL